ncbi:hypothetical protein FBZ99_101300 [Rhizobium sp. ERR 1071]|uniref:hypothetical protein n=1 Tax=Rhizobium sp. ERR 1071 TaxID=2572677 RepID=UPI00119B2655|nr:hypothetical protein [Rhizobium sp. ERR1071]TWB19527.1 hypothetical protein FBZ99_101300 [Rhizobium sp. ERR1071]
MSTASSNGDCPIFNGNFDKWQRGTSQTGSGYGSDDAWLNDNNGSTKTHSQQMYPAGQAGVPGNPRYYSLTTFNSLSGAMNFVRKSFRIENVRNFQGQQATLTFYAQADIQRPIAVELVQNFGTGGSPDVTVTGIGAQKVSIAPGGMNRYDVLFSVPSIAGKYLGTNEDSFLEVLFWFDAGTNFNLRTANLGQQSGSISLGRVSLSAGDQTANPDPFNPLAPGVLDLECRRRYLVMNSLWLEGYGLAGSYIGNSFTIPVLMRAAPIVTTTADFFNNSSSLYIGNLAIPQQPLRLQVTVTATGFAAAQFNAFLSADL